MPIRTPCASGIGSWPGTDPRDAHAAVRDLLADGHVPFLPELPDRGPGADLVGRTCSLLEGMPVDLQPSGWRLTDAPGRDVRRGRGHLRADLDELAEAYDGYAGPLKVALAGPFTLAAAVQLPRGERALSDTGAVRDLVQATTQAAGDLVARAQRAVPAAQVVLQLDEPYLPAVLSSQLPTASGLGTLRPLDPPVVQGGLTALAQAGGDVLLHCCAARPPLPLIRSTPGLQASVDTAALDRGAWDDLAETVETDRRLWAGVIPTDSEATHPATHLDPFLQRWRGVGLAQSALGRLVVTPGCGLAGRSLADARRILRLAVETANELGERAGLS